MEGLCSGVDVFPAKLGIEVHSKQLQNILVFLGLPLSFNVRQDYTAAGENLHTSSSDVVFPRLAIFKGVFKGPYHSTCRVSNI